ncbi:hypothetical protein [Stenotrophomonas acidaminiphila]|uniref:hypothetical protein n=1 Tax=Stenotrophomonas acidaminiphila TaxID=128780 RepID=UPI0039BC7864
MTTLQKRPTALFLPSRSLVRDDGTAPTSGGLLGGREWVVPRGECQYRQHDFSQLPARRRRAAARLAVPRFEPAPGAKVHIAWQQGVAHYWIWMPGEDGDDQVDYRRWLPESRLYAPPLESGARLLRVSQGVEGQIWHEGRLQASQWWPNPPDLQVWQRFLRAGGLGLVDVVAVPDPQRMDWSDTPWGESGGRVAIDAVLAERLAWWSIAFVLLFAVGWQVTALLRWNAAVEGGAARLEQVRKKAEPLLDARERAESAAGKIEDLLALQQEASSDYRLMLEVFSLLPEGTQMTSWSREPGKLRLTVASPEADPRKFILPFIEAAWLPDVTATPTGKGGMLLEFELASAATDEVKE